MQTVIVKLDTASHAAQVASFLKTIPYIKSVIVEPEISAPLTAADWVRPGRPATDEEIEKMLDECEKSVGLTTTEAKAETYKLLNEWHRKRKR